MVVWNDVALEQALLLEVEVVVVWNADGWNGELLALVDAQGLEEVEVVQHDELQ